MPTEKITKIGQMLNSWTAIILLVSGIIGWGFGTFYTISSNTSDISNLIIVIEDNNKAIEKEFEVHTERSDKRYKRVLDEAGKLFQYMEKIEERQYELTKEIYFLKGQNEK